MTFSTIPDTSLSSTTSTSTRLPPATAPAADAPTRPGRQRRQSQGPRHPGRDPHAPGHRAGPAARHPRGARSPRPLPRLRPGGPGDISRSGHRPLQGCDLADAGRRAADAPRRPRTTPAPGAPPSPPSTPRRWSCRRCTRPWHAWACPAMRPSWSPAAASATFWPTPRRACASSASSWTASPGASPGCSTPATTSASNTSATPACPRAASTPSSAMCPSPISGWTTTGCASPCMISFWPSPSTP